MIRQARYPNTAASVPAARRFVEHELRDLDASARDRVVLMVSELATNAVKHARSGFTLVLDRSGGSICVRVQDHGGGRPSRRNPPPTEPTGRGLLIVQGMSEDWGVEQHRNGKTVWFVIADPVEMPEAARPGRRR